MQHLSRLTLTMKSANARDGHERHKFLPSTSLQGVLMENIDGSYAESLHHLPFNPYSQYCRYDSKTDSYVWRVNALTDEAIEKILAPLSNLEAVSIKTFGETLDIEKKTVDTIPMSALADEVYKQDAVEGKSRKRISLRFVTPTAFKSKNEYQVFPTTHLIFQNLLMRYEYLYSGSKEADADTVEYLARQTRITAYNLRTRYFSQATNNRSKIPAFVGESTFCMNGPDPAVGLMRMLFRFAEYSGVGIKTSMGMGGVILLTERLHDNNQEGDR